MKFDLRKKYYENKNILLNIIGSFGVKGGAMIVTLLTTPAYMRYFSDSTVLGLWFTLLSVLNWVLSFDLGIGNGLRNKLTEVLEYKDYKSAKKYISSAYIILFSVSLALSLASFLVFPHINWNSIFNVGSDIVDSRVLLICVEIIFSGVMLQFGLKIISSILYAIQKSAITNLLALISSLLILAYVSVSPDRGIEINLLSLALFNIVAINVPLIVATIVVFNTSLRDSRPKFLYFDYKYAKAVLSVGLMFFYLQFASLLIGNTNEFLISNFISPYDVVEYQIYYKIFSLFNSMVNLAFTPIWSAATKKLVNKKFSWLKKIHNILLGFSVLSTILMLCIVPFLQNIVDLWLGSANSIDIKWQYGVVFTLSTGLMIWNGANCSIANGLGWLRAQSIFLTVGALLNVPLAFFFSTIMGTWLAIIFANILSLLPICIAQPIYIKRRLSKLAGNSKEH